MLPIWVEIHVDDEVLSADPSAWPEARRLIVALAAQATARGGRLCFRFREWFARAAIGTDTLPALAAAGHEVGVHAHGKRLVQATEAVRRCGVLPEVAVPGLVQVGRSGRAALLQQAAALGFHRVTDHSAERAWAYDGLLPRMESGVLVMSPTVRPFDWGLMETDGTRHPLRAAQIARLRRLEVQAAQQGAAWFGLALHEHDLCQPGTLTPDPDAMAALLSYLDERVVPAASVPLSIAQPAPARPPAPISDRRIKLVRAVRTTTARASSLRRRLPQRPHRRPRGGQRVRVGTRHVIAERCGPAAPQAVLVISHAGREGGRRLRLRPFGTSMEALTDRGWAVWLYDRAGTGRSPPPPPDGTWRDQHPLAPGHPAHTHDWIAVLQRARQEGVPVVGLSWSAGLVPVLRAAAAGHLPDAHIDGEGPADRWSLVPPHGNELARLDPWDDAVWAGWEPLPLLASLSVPYARLQASLDHIHGPDDTHARRLHAAAVRPRPYARLSGRLHAHPLALIEAMRWALQALKD